MFDNYIHRFFRMARIQRAILKNGRVNTIVGRILTDEQNVERIVAAIEFTNSKRFWDLIDQLRKEFVNEMDRAEPRNEKGEILNGLQELGDELSTPFI